MPPERSPAAEAPTARHEPRLTVARIAKPQGRRGEVAAQLLTYFPERLRPGRRVWLWDGAAEPEAAEIEAVWPHKQRLVFKFAGCDTRDEAAKLAGREVQILRREAAPLPAGTFFVGDLVGCRAVEAASGTELGRVRELVPTGATPLLAIVDDRGRELLLPFAEEFCRRIAPEEKLIEVVVPEGLRDLNP